MDNKEKLKELYQKLDLLEQRHFNFGDEISSLKAEIRALDPLMSGGQDDSSAASVIASRTSDAWPDQLDLMGIKGKVSEFLISKTKAGTKYVFFSFKVNGESYSAKIGETAKWVVEKSGSDAVASGVLNSEMTKFQVTVGSNKGMEFEGSDLTKLLIEAADLKSLKTVSVTKKTSRLTLKNKVVKSDWEKFIGGNLITIIGALVVFMGVIFGVKYSIDHSLINPLTRIVLGYAFGAGLLFTAFRLKDGYHNFSAIIASCAMAVMYFVTYAAYSFYGLLPQLLTFVMMSLFNGFTVLIATKYNRQVIAHIGLIGAYFVPFLLSTGSGDYMSLFSYMALLNMGILALAFRKNWIGLYYTTFAATWVIFTFWVNFSYVRDPSELFGMGVGFSVIFFLTFYVMLLANKLTSNQKVGFIDVGMLLLNSMVFYGVGAVILAGIKGGDDFLGLFTLSIGVIHLVAVLLIYKLKKAQSDLIKFISGLVLVFLTISIPVQMDGEWVTLLWSVEAVFVFWFARSSKLFYNEFMAYAIMVIALCSVLMDWSLAQNAVRFNQDLQGYQYQTFIASMLLSISLGVIYYLSRKKGSGAEFGKRFPEALRIFNYALPAALILITYLTFMNEINIFWNTKYMLSEVKVNLSRAGYEYPALYRNKDLKHFGIIASFVFSALFIGVLVAINRIKFQSRRLASLNIVSYSLLLFLFLLLGLMVLSELRVSYINRPNTEYFSYGLSNILVRYVAFATIVSVGVYIRREFESHFETSALKRIVELALYSASLWVLCAELIHLLNLSGVKNQYVLGVSILCGIYSFVMTGIGIRQKKQHLRLGSMILFGLVLLKLFLYDISHLSTIGKTVVFIVLGILLLVISFMYNKYKNGISDEN
jgi:uncharacterized membrane protein